jgi:hypothetical protein
MDLENFLNENAIELSDDMPNEEADETIVFNWGEEDEVK